MEYRIFPAIGIARLGNSAEFFVGPEAPGSMGHDITPAGEVEVTQFADAGFRKRKLAARFHLYQRATAADPFVPAVLPAGAKLRWNVRLANKKDAIVRPGGPPGSIPAGGLRPTLDATRANRLIDSGVVSIEGASAAGKFLDGTHVGVAVRLGELRTDANGRLLVLGGDGISRSNPAGSPIGGSFYNNPNWFDDVGDGPVNAEVIHSDGTVAKATGAWVIVGPPDFAPGAHAITSLYDVIRQVAINQGWLTAATATSYRDDINPMIRRARSLKWSHRNAGVLTPTPEANWGSISTDDAALADNTGAALTLRTQTSNRVREVENLLLQYGMTAEQKAHLQRYRNGTFDPTWTGVPAIPAITPDLLTQAALKGTAGQGFFPGIEGGRILTDPSIYVTPFDFRIDHAKLTPGDVTALMAQPWQADFLKCEMNWWPSQRPDIAPQLDGTFKFWARLGATATEPNHKQLVDHVMQFGMVVPKVGAADVCVEDGRDPAVGP